MEPSGPVQACKGIALTFTFNAFKRSNLEFRVFRVVTLCLCSSGAVCEIIWKYIVKPYRPQMTIWRMRIACSLLRLQTDTQNM